MYERFFCSKLYEISTLTLPQDEVNDFLVTFGFPESNSSAKPQEQSLHAFLFPVVPQTAKKDILWKRPINIPKKKKLLVFLLQVKI